MKVPWKHSQPALGITLAVLFWATPISLVQENQDPLRPLRFFIGRWAGEESGQAGIGTGEREYEFVLQGRFLQVKNRSVFKPQPDNPQGEVHEDWGFFSYDKLRGKIVLRQFHVEGYVNYYVLQERPANGNLVFVSESIENLPTGWRARYRFNILDRNSFEESFDLAKPGGDFERVLGNLWRRR